jgi:fructokinase
MSSRIGIDLGGTKIHGVLMDAAGDVRDERRMETPRDYDACVDAVCELARSLGGDDARVGIGAPGAWMPGAHAMKNCNSTWLNGRPLLDDLVARLGQRVRIANDADCFAWSEAVDGSGAGAASVFGVILGTGVGGGFVVNGALLEGPNRLVGEWGHTPLPYLAADRATAALERHLGERRCYCGRTNCIETFLSGPGFARTHHALTGDRRLPEEIVEAAAARESGSQRTLALYSQMLARSLAQIINVIDPHVIVLGGGMSNVAALYEEVPAAWGRHVFHGGTEESSRGVGTRLLRARHGDASGVRGAAWLWPA